MTTTATQNFDKTVGSMRVGVLRADKGMIGPGWTRYTPTLTGGTLHANDTQEWFYRIEGTTLYIQGCINHTAAAGGSTTSYALSLPAGCVADSKTVDLAQACGSAVFSAPAGVQTLGTVTISSNATTFLIWIQTGAATAAIWGESTTATLKFSSVADFWMSASAAIRLKPTCTAVTGTFP